MIAYRITKYNPINRNENGYYMLDDWTSVSDIEKCKVTRENYFLVENNYIITVKNIIEYLTIEKLKIDGLEQGLNLKKCFLNLYENNIFLDKNQQYIFKTIRNNKFYNIKEITSVVKLILRECLWCRLVSPKVKFTFGYDYYMYFYSVAEFDFSLISVPDGIYIERFDEELKKYIYLK